MSRVRKAYPREEKLLLIVAIFADKVKSGEWSWVGTAAIARELNQTPQNQFRRLLESLVVQGALVSKTEPYPGAAGKRVLYALNDQTYQNAEYHNKKAATAARRSIRLNTAHGVEMLVLS
jgi:hypothetical protein